MVKKVKEIKDETSVDTKKIRNELDKYLADKKEEIITNIGEEIDKQVEFKVNKRMREEEKKIVRGKNGKIFRRDIIILLLFLLVGYFAYCLYEVDYFHIRTKIVYKTVENNKEKEENNIKEDESIKNEFDSRYYIKEYGYLVDNLLIDDESVFSLFNKGVTKDDISNELKLKIAYKNLSDEEKLIDNNTISFKEEDLLNSAKNLFGSDIIIKNEIFTYNKTRFMFYNDTYLGFMEKHENVGLLTKLEDVKKEDDKLIFNVVVGKLTNDNNLVNDKNKVVIKNYKNEDLLDYKEELASYNFTFVEDEGSYIFDSVK